MTTTASSHEGSALASIGTVRTLLVCPLDHVLLGDQTSAVICPACGFVPSKVTLGTRTVLDFRAVDRPQTLLLNVTLPVAPLDRQAVATQFFRAPAQTFTHYSRAEVRQRFGTKLDKGMQFYCQQVLRDHGPDAPILDLGCGNGGNKRYLQSLGFKQVVSVDWSAAGADMLVDAHRLPFADTSFQLVLSTAVFEHLYHPFLAMREISRTLRLGGYFVGSASFWEAWHGASYFHLTPDGWNALCKQAGLQLRDLWEGWGVLPAILSHVLVPGRLRSLGYVMQGAVNQVYRWVGGEAALRRLHLRASGSYQVYAAKSAPAAM